MPTWTAVLALAAAAAAVSIAALILVLRVLRKPPGPDPAAGLLQTQLCSLGDRIQELTQATSQQLQKVAQQVQSELSNSRREVQGLVSGTQTQINQRLDSSAQILSDVQKTLGVLKSEAAHMAELGKDIHGLQDLLRSPKLRGGLGEMMLERMLQQCLPPEAFELQYAFSDGQRVDAVIVFPEGKVPIDSKFPLEKYLAANRPDVPADQKAVLQKEFLSDVRKRVDETARYIRPGEGTFDFALMYVPAESIYYEIIVQDERLGEKQSLLAYAASRKVLPVSPNSLYAYLQVIVLGLKGMKVEKEAKAILEALTRVQSDFGKFRDDFARVGKKIEDAGRAYGEADKRFDLLDKKMEKVTGHTAEELAVLEESSRFLPEGEGGEKGRI